MAKTHKRVLSLILSLVMVLSLLPIQALAAVSISCTASDGAVITVTGDIPENAVVTAVPVPVELEGMKTLGAYDINITVDGAAWQPESPVEVSIGSPAFEGYEELSVFHVDTDQALDYIDQYFGFLEQIMNFIKGLFSQKISSDVVSFMAEHFSIYAVGAPYVATYNFYDGDGTQIQNATQILKAGDEVQLPAAPAGDGIFQGWYIDGTTPLDGSYQVPELSEDKTYSVYPKFDGVYYVTFYDTTGTTVVATIPVDTTGSAVVGDAINTVEPVLEAGKILVGWSTMQGSDANFTASTPVTGNISVYPVLRDGVVVTFDSRGGSPSVTTVTAEADGTVAPPSDPTRSGFHFDGWYTDPTGGDEVDFTYYRPEANEILYAHWTASDTSYTIQYWAENADDKDYTYAAAETVNGTAGAVINLTQNQMDPSKLGRTDSAGFTYSRNDSEGQTVAGDGTTIVNVYFERNTYTVKFWVQGVPCGKEEHTHSWWCYNWRGELTCGKEEHEHTDACYGGVETDGDWYVWKAVTAKYGAYIGNQWPGSNWGISATDTSTSQSFLSVMPLDGDDFYWHNDGAPGATDSDKSSADYYVEALPGTAGTVQFDGKSFVWHHKDTARSSGLSTTAEDFYDIAGFDQHKYTSGKQTYSYGDWGHSYNGAKFYYTRNSYTIDFYVDGNKTGSASVAYEAAIGGTLDANKPTTPSQPGYTFEGWYLDPECKTPVPADMTMSDGNLAVYGQWVPPVVNVNVYYTTASDQAVSAGTFSFGHVLLATDLEDGVETAASATGHDVADFLGWYVQSGTGYAAYTFGSALTSDVTLYARWRGDTYTVTYQGSEGDSYADSGKYALGSEAKALTFAATGLTAPEGKEFSHWETADGTEVKPGETLSISGNVTLTAVYVDEVDVPTVTVTYNANGGKGDDVTTEAMPVNSLFMVKSDTECGFTNPGYRFIGWATEEGPVAEKDLIQPGKEMRADNDGANILYAQWEQAVFKITYELDGGTNADSNPNTYTYGVGVESFAPATKTGYTFQGWYSDAGFTTPVTGIGTDESGDKTFYAKWTRNTYQVKVQYQISSNGSSFQPFPPQFLPEGLQTEFAVNAGENWTITVGEDGGTYVAPGTLTMGQSTYVFDRCITPGPMEGDSDDLTVTLVYGKDVNGNNDGPDDVPDYYQKVVTYKVYNGTWSDGSKQDKSQWVTLTDAEGNWSTTGSYTLTENDVPQPGNANTGHKADQWYKGEYLNSADPKGNSIVGEEITKSTTYLYNFKVMQFTLTVVDEYVGGPDACKITRSEEEKTYNAFVEIAGLQKDAVKKGYTFDKVTVEGGKFTINGSSVNGRMPAEDVVVTFTYKPVKSYVMVEHRYVGGPQDTNPTMPENFGSNGILSTQFLVEEKQYFDYGNAVSFPALTEEDLAPGYVFSEYALLIWNDTVQSLPFDETTNSFIGTMPVGPVHIVFYYAPRTDLSYTVKYVDKDTNTEIAPSKTVDGQTFGTEVTETAIDIEGYALDDVNSKAITIDVEDNEIIFYYAKDEKGNGNDGEDPDGIPDKYQAFLKFVADEGGKVSETNRTITFPDNADSGTVSVDDVTATADQDYLFGQWTSGYNTDVCATAILNASIENVPGNTTITFTARFDKDVLVDPSEEDKTPDKPGDGIPDKYQVTVYYRAVNGTVSMPSTVVTKKDTNGNPAENGTAKLDAAHIPTATPIAGYVAAGNLWTPVTPRVDLTVVDGQTFTANYVYIPPYIPPTDPGTDIDDPDVPLADLPGLNTVDHYAYIAGYEDGTVRPNNNITRAEVATIFFRLFTDEYRETYWSTNNPFSDVAYTAWYNNAVSTTSNAGIIAGYPDGTFQPNNYITRAEFATIAARFLSEEYVGPDLFTDISGHWAAEYINRAANAGWINGYPDGSFRPNAYITRAEAMTLVNSMLGRMPHKDHMLENMVKWPDNPEAAWYYEAVQEATNGHDYDWYEEEDQLFYEIWTALQPNRDWAALEKEWSNAYSAPGGEVIG